jgi:G3E family GTPase
VDDDIQEAYRLDAILTIVDAKHIAQHLDEEKPEGVENESVEQIAFADVIMLNKCDLVSAEQLTAVKDKIKAINTYSAVFETRFSVVPLRNVLGISAFDLTRVVEMDSAFLDVGATLAALPTAIAVRSRVCVRATDGEHKHDESVTSVGIKCTGAMHPETFKAWLSELLQEKGVDIFRSKASCACVLRGYVCLLCLT